jgi:hypothetical protein
VAAVLAAPVPPPAGTKRKRDEASASSSAGGGGAAIPAAWQLRSLLELTEENFGGAHEFILRPRTCALCGSGSGGGSGASSSSSSSSAAAAAAAAASVAPLQPCALRFALAPGAPALSAAAAQRERVAQGKAAAFYEGMESGLGQMGLCADFVGRQAVQERHARVEADWAAGVGHCTLALCAGCLGRPHACKTNISEMPERAAGDAY